MERGFKAVELGIGLLRGLNCRLRGVEVGIRGFLLGTSSRQGGSRSQGS
jgi:hypothetical protein